MLSLVKQPSAWLPVAMSIAAILLVLGYVAIYGVQGPQRDEGAAARTFQLLLAAQVPMVVYFAIRWVPAMPRQALPVVALQIVAALAAAALVVILEM